MAKIGTASVGLDALSARVREMLRNPRIPQNAQHDVFLSYRHADTADLARSVYQALGAIRHPITRRSIRVFLDVYALRPGQNIHVVLQNAMRSSATYIVLLSPTYSKTEYTAFEHMVIAGEDWGGLSERILPVLTSDCEIPHRLRDIKYLDLTALSHSTPLAPSKGRSTLIQIHCVTIP
ncbi:MAG: toll/interleukin-1 receptor domain-containing protein [Phycisphaerae bacterium]|nr:toll/interleukin-1 receptor domain-containing protein [Phycisphaerae bacterium]